MKTVVLLLCVASCAAHMSFTERILLASAEAVCGKGKVAAAATAKCASDKCGKDDFVSGACCVNVQACSAGKSDTLKCAVSATLVDDAAGTCAGALCVAADFGDKDSNCCRTPPNQICSAGDFNDDAKCAAATTGQIFDTSKASTECAAATCVKTDCCKAAPNQICSAGDFNDDAKCAAATTGQIFDTSKASTECAAATCVKTDCCKTPPAAQLCTAGVAAAKAAIEAALGSAATAAPSAVLAVCTAALFARL